MHRIIQSFFRHMMRDKDMLYVLCPCSIGDFLVVGGLCHALLKKKRKKACVLIEHERYKNSGRINFVGVMEVMYLSNHLAPLMQQYAHTTRDYETDNYVYGHFHMRDRVENWSSLIWNENLSFVDRYKENVFGLPLDTELIPPIISSPTNLQKQRLHEAYVLDKERTIIIMPYTSGGSPFPESFWVKLVQSLKQKNKDYIFYTNVASPQEKVIPGTAPIVTTFPELIYLAEKVNCFIGLRSGIFDLLAFTNAKLLYINRNIKDWWFFDLKLNFNHTNSRAFYLLSVEEQESLKPFMQRNNLTSIDNLILNDHVLGKDVSLSPGSLIEKIVSSVD